MIKEIELIKLAQLGNSTAFGKLGKFLQEENLARWPNQIMRALREY